MLCSSFRVSVPVWSCTQWRRNSRWKFLQSCTHLQMTVTARGSLRLRDNFSFMLWYLKKSQPAWRCPLKVMQIGSGVFLWNVFIGSLFVEVAWVWRNKQNFRNHAACRVPHSHVFVRDPLSSPSSQISVSVPKRHHPKMCCVTWTLHTSGTLIVKSWDLGFWHAIC